MVGWVGDPQIKKKKKVLLICRFKQQWLSNFFFLNMKCFVQINFTPKHKTNRTEESKSVLHKQSGGPQSPHSRPL